MAPTPDPNGSMAAAEARELEAICAEARRYCVDQARELAAQDVLIAELRAEVDRMRAAIELAHESIARQTAIRPDAVLSRVAADLGEFVRGTGGEGE